MLIYDQSKIETLHERIDVLESKFNSLLKPAEELTGEKQKSRYEVRDKAWLLNGRYKPIEVILLNKEMNGDTWYVGVEGKLAAWYVEEENIYPTKQALISAQIEYWTNLEDGKKCKHEPEMNIEKDSRPRHIKGTLPMCSKCGEFYK